MKYPIVEMTEERLSVQRVVCSAIQDSKTGRIWCGPRHSNCFWMINESGVDDKAHFIQGFVDQFFNFLTRQKAWVVAKNKNQIVHRVGGDEQDGGCLYSENLY